MHPPPPPINLDAIIDQLNELKLSVNELSTKTANPGCTEIQFDCEISPTKPKSPSSAPDAHHQMKCIDKSLDNFLTEGQIKDTLELLNSETFYPENGHLVALYGDKYKYMGSKAETINDLPTQLQTIMDELNIHHTGGLYKLNSCLVNKYPDNNSHLPEHSDDEFSIRPDSCIFTISIGDSRTVTFRDKLTNEESSHECTNGNLYSMTRDSQAMYSHRIDKCSNSKGMRYSLTFRCVHYSYFNSTIIIGDSNASKIKFGDTQGTLGSATPGRAQFAATIEDINPFHCASYSNVVIMVGTNNLKLGDVKYGYHIRDLYKQYKHKIQLISQVNKRCKIFVCPVLPSKLISLNKKCIYFNQFLSNDLVQSNSRVTKVEGFGQFYDRETEKLVWNLSNPDPNDTLHINAKSGIRLLVKLIKQSIFSRKRTNGKAKVHSGRTFANTLRGGPA